MKGDCWSFHLLRRGSLLEVPNLVHCVPDIETDADALKPTELATAAEAGVSKAWGWIIGFAVVFVATFGPVIVTRAEASEVSATAPVMTPNRSVTNRSGDASVKRG